MSRLDFCLNRYPGKFVKLEDVFGRKQRGGDIFIDGMRATPVYRPEPYPVRRIQCQSFFRAEILGIRAPGAALEAIEKFRLNFRLNAFFSP